MLQMDPQMLDELTRRILDAGSQASDDDGDAELRQAVIWPVTCTVGPGLEGAIACETRVGFVNGSRGALSYRGYDIFDLCAHSSFEEVSYLLLHGNLPDARQLKRFTRHLVRYRQMPQTLRHLMSFPVERMHPMEALRLGVNLMRHEFTAVDAERPGREPAEVIAADDDSIAMETQPTGSRKAVYEFAPPPSASRPSLPDHSAGREAGIEACYHLIAGLPVLAAAIARLREGRLPTEPRADLSHAANLLYMLLGREPTPVEERAMDVSLILHADHGMNASTFASLVVASTLSDIYFAVGAGISALNGPLHGGANERVVHMLHEIGEPEAVKTWYRRMRRNKQKVMGFGHRVYRACDPRARALKPLAELLSSENASCRKLLDVAMRLENEVVRDLGKSKRIFPNVDLYSGIVYASMAIPSQLFTPLFAVSRVAGWTARVMEYLQNNRIFRPRAAYIGPTGCTYVSLPER